MKISGVYIVKNEENNLRRSIESIQAVCDEIIVVDTGSTDGTVALAEELGARVEHFKWRNDFAAARNYALSFAKGDFIIFLDADEWFPRPLDEKAKAYLEEKVQQGFTVFFFEHWDYENGNAHSRKYLIRAYANFKGYKYIGAIHERVDIASSVVFNLSGDLFTLYHAGYTRDIIENKLLRNINALENTLKGEHNRQKKLVTLYYLAREHLMLGNIMVAHDYIIQYFKLYDRFQSGKNDLAPSPIMIGAFHIRNKIALEGFPNVTKDADQQRYIQEFLEAFPQHPVSSFDAAMYEYTCRSDIQRAYALLLESEYKESQYDSNAFFGDITTFSTIAPQLFLHKGRIDIYYRRYVDALESAVKALQLGHPAAWSLILKVVLDQPVEEIAAFIDKLSPEMDLDTLTVLLENIRQHPQLKNLYQYYAIRHIKHTNSHSDITAIITLFEETPDLEHITEVAVKILEEDDLAANTLMCVALMFAPDISFYNKYREQFDLKEILESYFHQKPLENPSPYIVNLLYRVSKTILFVDDGKVADQFFKLFEAAPYEGFRIAGDYYLKAGEYNKILERSNFSITSLRDDREKLTYYLILAETYIGLQQYDAAIDCCASAVGLARDNLGVKQELIFIRCQAPEYEERINRLLFRLKVESNRIH